jgi:hypothetical protein
MKKKTKTEEVDSGLPATDVRRKLKKKEKVSKV